MPAWLNDAAEALIDVLVGSAPAAVATPDLMVALRDELGWSSIDYATFSAAKGRAQELLLAEAATGQAPGRNIVALPTDSGGWLWAITDDLTDPAAVAYTNAKLRRCWRHLVRTYAVMASLALNTPATSSTGIAQRACARGLWYELEGMRDVLVARGLGAPHLPTRVL